MNRTKQLMMSLFAVAVLGLSATAQAQDTPPPSEPPPSPPPTAHRSSGGGDGAGIGVGAGVTLTGGTFGQFVYDQAIWHLEGLLNFGSFSTGGGGDRLTTVGFGAGGWYHLHRGSSSDFSLGGALTVNTASQGGASSTVTALEPGAQIRAFITSNVALSARVGLAFLFGDTDGGGTDFLLLGQAQAAFGITYFFR
jgi:hypothetical protein